MFSVHNLFPCLLYYKIGNRFFFRLMWEFSTERVKDTENHRDFGIAAITLHLWLSK